MNEFSKSWADPWRITLFFLIAFGIRFLFLVFSPYDLSPDEAYYWDWSRRLDWCYYSKPPMVAWLMALSTFFWGDTEFGVRFPAMFLSNMTLLFLFMTASYLAGGRAGLMAAALVFASIGGAVSSYIMTIDAPLLFFWSVALYALVRAICPGMGASGSNNDGAVWWIMAAVATGLGLLSKQTMIALPAALFLFLLFSPGKRYLLRTGSPWLYLLLSLLFLLPLVVWNMHHGWITLEHTAHHFHSGSGAEKWFFNLKTFGEFFGAQLGIANPVAFILLLLSLVLILPGCIRQRTKDGGEKWGRECWTACFLLFAGPLLLFLVMLLSLKQRVNANWPAPFYLSGAVLLAWLWAGRPAGMFSPVLLKGCRFLKIGIVFGLAAILLLYSMPAWLPNTSLYGTRKDPTVRIRGWHELGAEAGRRIAGLPKPDRTFVITLKRQTASELAFYLPGQPVVYRWRQPGSRVKSQYELWPGPGGKMGWDALIVIGKGRRLPKMLQACFREVRPMAPIEISMGNGEFRRYRLWHGIDLKDWPTP